jgi:hypothetical protein
MIIASHNLSTRIMFLSLIVFAIIYYIQYISVVYGEIIPFPRQEIKDGIQESAYLNTNIDPDLTPKIKQIYDNPMDVVGVSHFSDGKNLNATLWSNGTITKDHPQIGVRELEYGALVDIDNRIGTGKFDVDFQKQIKHTKGPNNWTSVLIEYSSSGFHNIVTETRNLTNIEEEKPVLPLSIDLTSITSPSKFRIAYYTVVTFNDSSKIIDTTGWIDVPPAEFSLTSSPNPLILTKGESMDIGAQLMSNTGLLPKVLNFTPEHNQSQISVQFNPNRENTSSFHAGPVPFRISATLDAQSGKYMIPIQGNASMESTKLGVPSINASILGESYFTIKPNLTVTVVNPPSLEDDFKEFWTSYGQVISLFGAGFLGAFSTHIIDVMKQRKKEKKQA